MKKVTNRATALVAMLGLLLATSAVLAQAQAGSFEFDPEIDKELADFILEREAELADVQIRGAMRKSSQSRILGSTSKVATMSVQDFRAQTRASGLQLAVDHIEAVRKGARPNPEFVARVLLDHQAANPDQDVMAQLFRVFRESIQQTNKDRRYSLERLRKNDKVSKAVAEYLRQLNEAMAASAGGGANSQCNEGPGPEDVDMSILDQDHRVLVTQMLKQRAWTTGNDGMARTQRQLLRMRDQLRGRRVEFTTAFENFDQKANQLYNMLTTTLKNIKEMQMGVQRNTL